MDHDDRGPRPAPPCQRHARPHCRRDQGDDSDLSPRAQRRRRLEHRGLRGGASLVIRSVLRRSDKCTLTVMTTSALNATELEVVRRIMQATFQFFDDDFDARLGMSTETMRNLLDAWPAIDDSNDEGDACLAINNSLNDLLHGVGIDEKQAMAIAGVSLSEIRRIYRKWAAARGWKSTGVR